MLYFENTRCEKCARTLGYDPGALVLRALEPDGEDWVDRDGVWRFCVNLEQGGCNWLTLSQSAASMCLACRHNQTIPDLSDPGNVTRWRALESAKRRLIYSLLRLGLPLATRAEDPEHGLAFDLLADMPARPQVLTGHNAGLITISLKEGDDSERERMREQMGEVYRTPLGHFRHEIGHHYWDLLVRDTGALEPFRALFGDERQDYAQALNAHYARPAQEGWQNCFVSVYAGSHPWEDFAETWAHYLHIVDTVEMAASFGVSIHPRLTREPGMQAEINFDPYHETDMAVIMDAWLPLSSAMNSLNRAMGQHDVYPFVLSPNVVEKLRFIHRLVHRDA